MKAKRSIILGMITGLLFLTQSCCKPGVIGSVNNTLRPQETNNWCWAATTQMIAQNEGISKTQCELANHRFGKTNCCDDEPTDNTCRKTNDCNSPGWLELDYSGLKFSETSTALSWEELKRSIYCSKDILGFAYGQSGVVGHVVAVKGYVTVNGINYVVLNDPWSPCMGQERLITYDEYVNPSGASTHWNTWYNISKK